MQPRNVHPWRTFLGALVILVTVAAVYAPGLSGDFIFDDFSNIVFNTKVHAEEITWESVSAAAKAYSGPIGRPLATIGFAIDYSIGGKSPLAFKIHSLCVHVLNALLVLVLTRRLLLASEAGRNWRHWAPLAISLAWAIHPIQVSTVLYVVQRMEMLSATFVLAGLISYVAARQDQMAGKPGWCKLAASVLLPALGLLAKESAILFPLYYLALELTLFHFKAYQPAYSKALKTAFVLALGFGALAFFGVAVPQYGSAEDYSMRSFGMDERVLTQFRVLTMYLGQIALPSIQGMPFYYDDIEASTGLTSPLTTLGGALFLGTLSVAAWILRKNNPYFSLGVFLFFAAHALTSSPINLELAFEHRNYLASFGVVIAVAALFSRPPLRLRSVTEKLSVTAVVILLGVMCAIRAASWGDPLVLAMDLASMKPGSPRASHDLGATYVRYAQGNAGSPFLDLALKEFERGSGLGGTSALPEQGLILTSAMAGRPAKQEWWDALDAKIRNQPVGPELHLAVTGILSQHREGARVDSHRLAQSYQALLDRKPDWPGYMYATFGEFVLEDLGDVARARDLYVKAVEVDPGDRNFAHRVLAFLVREGHPEITSAVSRRMLELGLLDSQSE